MLINLSGITAAAPPGALVVRRRHARLRPSPGSRFTVTASPAWRSPHRQVGAAPRLSTSPRPRVRTSPPSCTKPPGGNWSVEAIDAAETVPIDTGLAWFDASTQPNSPVCSPNPPCATSPRARLWGPCGINLYGDLLLPLAESTERLAYLGDESDGPATPGPARRPPGHLDTAMARPHR